MKRWLFVLAFLALGSRVDAQVNVIVHAEWQAPAVSPANPAPTSYGVQFDGGPVVSVPATLNAACNCIRSAAQNITDTAAHTFTIVSVALTPLGPMTSTPLVLPFAVLVPAIPTNGAVKVGP